jgi:hypothetical protein
VSAPTDMELMLFHDGELEEPRRAEVAAWLEQSQVGRAKVAGVSLGGELLRESALVRAASFDIADAVMAATKRQNGAGETIAADGASGAKVIPIKSKTAPKAAPQEESGKDGGRLLLPLTAIAAAAAAALFYWGRTEPAKQHEVAKNVPTETAPSVQPLPPTPAPAPTELEPFAKAEEPEPGVRVASVNFGSRQGSVFIVGDESLGPTTAVVWVTEE